MPLPEPERDFHHGYGSLIEGASQDGVHLYADYLAMMLDYLKNYYIPVEASGADASAEAATEAES